MYAFCGAGKHEHAYLFPRQLPCIRAAACMTYILRETACFSACMHFWRFYHFCLYGGIVAWKRKMLAEEDSYNTAAGHGWVKVGDKRMKVIGRGSKHALPLLLTGSVPFCLACHCTPFCLCMRQ